MNKQQATRAKNMLRRRGYSTTSFSNNGFVVAAWKPRKQTHLVFSLADAAKL